MPEDNLDPSLPKRIQSYVEERTGEVDGVRLNKAPFLDPCLRLTPPQKAVADNLFRTLEHSQKIFRKSRTETFEILCANLLYSTSPIIVPMDTHYWIGEGKKLSSTIIKDVNLLKQQNYIGVKTGNPKIRRYTRIYPKKGFNMLPLRQNPGIDYKPDKYVILRKTKFKGYKYFENPLTGKRDQKRHVKKIEIDYKPTRETERVTDILRKYWYVCHEHRIELEHPRYPTQYLVTALTCSHTNDLRHGGRLYTHTEWGIQQLEKDWRKFIKIDGEQTVELDFSGLSIRMLYAKIDRGFDGDPYTGVLDAIPRLNSNEKEVIRDFMKKLLQAILNSDEKADAVGSGNFEIHEQCKREEFEVVNVLRRHGISVSQLVDMFEELHHPISQYFYSGIGLDLQYRDSRIALKVIHHFNQRRIPVLAVHDSFIIQSRYADQLHSIMSKSYMSVMHTSHECPIK
ncbi:MAG: hypothetical protein ACLQVJ_14970 [Syntrophobacteraceae bacterium]